MINNNFGKNLVFVDEAGDHVLRPSYKEFPLFVLSFCVVEKQHYCDFILPEFTKIKLKYFNDINCIFHEREIRKAIGQFSFLTNGELRSNFMQDIDNFIKAANFKVIATVIDKEKLGRAYDSPNNPYYLAMEYCLESLANYLKEVNDFKDTTVTFEARGAKENKELELAFLRECSSKFYEGKFTIDIKPKSANIAGLQLADLVARPIGRYVFNENQENRAFDILKSKFRSDKNNGKFLGYGLKIFP